MDARPEDHNHPGALSHDPLCPHCGEWHPLPAC